MAILRNLITGQQVLLRAHHVFGRTPRADTLLHNKDASQLHASIRWTGKHWEILDHSRNGTALGSESLAGGKTGVLSLSAEIQFGVTRESVWRVIDLAPPQTSLFPVEEGGPVYPLEDFNLLPDETTPEISIFLSATGQWMLESKEDIKPLNDGDIVSFGGKSWKLVCSPTLELTAEVGTRQLRPESLVFDFRVSLDEEHVFLRVLHGDREVDLGERSHHYCLVALARKRLEDASRQVDPDNQGWIDLELLSKMLGLEPAHLNIQIFRARNQLMKAFPDWLHPPGVVERRRGGVRFGQFKFKIVRGNSVEGVFTP